MQQMRQQVRTEAVRVPGTAFTRSDEGMRPAVPENILRRPLELSPMVNIKGDRPPEDPFDGLLAAVAGV